MVLFPYLCPHIDHRTSTQTTTYASLKSMLVHRISHKKYIADLSGTGAWLNGGRWNSQHRYILYTSQNHALSAWEYFVNMDRDFEKTLPTSLCHASILLPDNLVIKTLNSSDLPNGWDSTSTPKIIQKIGDAWLDSLETLVLKVPSAVIHSEFNYLINPKHPDFHLVKIQSIEPFHFDKRLFNKKLV